MTAREGAISLAVEIGRALVTELLVPALRRWRNRKQIKRLCEYRCGDCGLICNQPAGHEHEHRDARGHEWTA